MKVHVNLVIYKMILAEKQSNGHVTELKDDTEHEVPSLFHNKKHFVILTERKSIKASYMSPGQLTKWSS